MRLAADILLMDGSLDSIGWVIALALFLLFDIVVPMLKKRARRSAPPPEPTPVEYVEPVISRPVARRPEAPRAAPRPAAPRPAAKRIEELSPERLIQDLFAPLSEAPRLKPHFLSRRIRGILAQAAGHHSYPLSAAQASRMVAFSLLETVPGLRKAMARAAATSSAMVEINSIEDLLSSPDALAVGWLEPLFADAVGVALMGPAYAAFRVRLLQEQNRLSVLELDVASNRAVVLDPPVVVVAPALRSALEEMGHGYHASRFDRFVTELCGEDTTLTLRLSGLPQQDMEFSLDAGPSAATTERMLLGMLRTPVEALGGRSLSALVQEGEERGSYKMSVPIREALERGVASAGEAGLPRLLACVEFAALRGLDALRRALAVRAAPASVSTAAALPPGTVFSPTLPAIVEGIILGEILEPGFSRPRVLAARR